MSFYGGRPQEPPLRGPLVGPWGGVVATEMWFPRPNPGGRPQEPPLRGIGHRRCVGWLVPRSSGISRRRVLGIVGGGVVGGIHETGGLVEVWGGPPVWLLSCGWPDGRLQEPPLQGRAATSRRPYRVLVLGLLLLGHHALAGVYDCAGCYHDHCEDDQDDRPGRESSAFLFNRWQRHCRGRLRWRWRRH